jgi:hypothetical protein
MPAEDWLDLADTDGELLGMCCGTISEIRDVFLGSLRGGRTFDMKDLEKVAWLALSHEPWMEYEESHVDEEDIIWRLVRLWNAIKDKCKKYRSKPHSIDVNDVDVALSAMQHMPLFISMERHVSNPRRGCLLWQTSKMWPFVKVLYEKFGEVSTLPMEGWGAVDEEGELASTVGGPAMYPTEEELDKVMECWDEETRAFYTKKKVKLSAKEGLTIIDDHRPTIMTGCVLRSGSQPNFTLIPEEVVRAMAESAGWEIRETEDGVEAWGEYHVPEEKPIVIGGQDAADDEI